MSQQPKVVKLWMNTVLDMNLEFAKDAQISTLCTSMKIIPANKKHLTVKPKILMGHATPAMINTLLILTNNAPKNLINVQNTISGNVLPV